MRNTATNETRQVTLNQTVCSCYPAGHMMYDTRAGRAALARDIAAFIADVNATPPPRR